jgi:23S rRNA pseudouridine1911/1915/1917 synthase
LGGRLMLIDDYDVEILFEDNHLLFVKKPFGVIVQEDNTKDMDMVNILKQYIKEKYNRPGNVFIGLVHRLDRPAGGAMVFAKTSKGAARLSEQIRNRSFGKNYYAIVEGILEKKEGGLENYLIKDTNKNFVKVVNSNLDGKFAKLNYKVKMEKENFSLVEIELETGRFHQIRVQFSNIGHPLYGDIKYGGKQNKYYNGIGLWSSRLSILHPTKGNEIRIIAKLPDILPWGLFSAD